MTVCSCTKAHLIGIDGGLRHIDPMYVDEMQKKGWRLVVNPKRTYYAEYDQTHPNYVKIDNVDGVGDLLRVIAL